MGKCLFLRKGETHIAPYTGLIASGLAVGSTVKLMENGTAVEYMVVHQGLPSTAYDPSCNGTWLLRKNAHTVRAWSSFQTASSYKASSIYNWLENTFFNTFGPIEQSVIKQVTLPYENATARAFLLSGIELGIQNNSNIPVDGAKLDFFDYTETLAAAPKRVAYNAAGSAAWWWTRSVHLSVNTEVHAVHSAGYVTTYDCDTAMPYARPALIIPSTALFDEDTMFLKGVA